MKKWMAMLLLAAMMLSLAACGKVNDSPVAILWSGDGEVKVPNSLINSMERAMYIENIRYHHYGANGNPDTQIRQAREALEAGCAALMVELVTDVADAAAKAIIAAAKAKNVPVVFFNCNVSDDVLAGYEKAALVSSDASTQAKVYGKVVFETIAKQDKLLGIIPQETYSINEELDRNGDGKISYIPAGAVGDVVAEVNALLKEHNLPELEIAFSVTGLFSQGDFAQKLIDSGAELILTDRDTTAKQVLLGLQSKGYNADKLKTHCIPLFTVGNTVDYKAHVMQSMPTPPHALDTQDKEEQKAMKKWWRSEEMDQWRRDNANLCDLSGVEWTDLNAYLYTTADVVAAGRLAGTILEDYDAISTTAATVVRNLLTGKPATNGIENAQDRKVLVSYTTYGG